MRYSCLGLLVASLLVPPTLSYGQDCYLGVYADAEGSMTIRLLTPLDSFDFYVVAHVEDDVQSFSYGIESSELGLRLFVTQSWWGPQGLGPYPPSLGGETVELGGCTSGYGGEPVLVARYEALSTDDMDPTTLCVVPDAAVDPDHPVYESCEGVSSPCAVGPCLYIMNGLPTGSTSWGAVKSLYH
jgi:hypothetical protein